jgi:hypothetical protein
MSDEHYKRIAEAAIEVDSLDCDLWDLERRGCWHNESLRVEARAVAVRLDLAKARLADLIAVRPSGPVRPRRRPLAPRSPQLSGGEHE